MTARKLTLEERFPTYGKAVPRRTQAVMEGLRKSAMRFARDIEVVCAAGEWRDQAMIHVEEALALANKDLRQYGVIMKPTEKTEQI